MQSLKRPNNFVSKFPTKEKIPTADKNAEIAPDVIEQQIFDYLTNNYPLAPGKKVMVAVSGGIDSTTLLAALRKFYGHDKVIPVFVNTGLLRRDYPLSSEDDFGYETDRLLKLLQEQFGDIIYLDERVRYIKELAKATGFDDAETDLGRRQIIGNLFADIFGDYADMRGDIQYFFQGSNAADKSESGKGKTGVFTKTHHNEVPWLAERLENSNIEVVEPLEWIWKHQVISLGEHLGLSMELYNQPAFPGPGLGVRVDGTLDNGSLDFTGICDAIVRYRIEQAIASGKIKKLDPTWKTRQYFAALLNTADNNGHGSRGIDGVINDRFKEMRSAAGEILGRWIANYSDLDKLSQHYVTLCNTISTTGVTLDGKRVDGYQVEVRMFYPNGSPAEIDYAEREQLANNLMKIKDVSRVSYALTQVKENHEHRGPDGKLLKIEINSVDTLNFSTFVSTDIPMSVYDDIAKDIQGRFGNNVLITAAFGGKPGRTTERH
ncbi:MAG: hypothetical protein FWD33_00820 [Alphaproteobacteria bacterium]|nr:hypothetical protein [Alphaproteobacteria bacterium]